MRNVTSVMSNQSVNRPNDADAEIENLARETDMPVEVVQQIYTNERARLERTARIKTYVPVLIHRQVKGYSGSNRLPLNCVGHTGTRSIIYFVRFDNVLYDTRATCNMTLELYAAQHSGHFSSA